jgi:membrane protein required for colicin V production
LDHLTAVDWLVIAVLGLSLVFGAWRGLAREAIALLSWIVAFWLSQHYAAWMSQWLPMSGSSQMLRYVAGFVVVFVLSLMAMSLLAWALQKMLSAVGLGPLDRLLGVFFGLLRGWVILMVITLIVNLTPLREIQAWQQARTVPWLNWSLSLLKPVLPADFGKYLSSCVESSAWSVTHQSIS